MTSSEAYHLQWSNKDSGSMAIMELQVETTEEDTNKWKLLPKHKESQITFQKVHIPVLRPMTAYGGMLNTLTSGQGNWQL